MLDVLQSEGFIRGYAKVERTMAASRSLKIELKYYDGEPVIREIKRVSKPGRRVYASVKTLPVNYNGLGISILSTSKGVMSDSEARNQNVVARFSARVF